MNAMWGSGGVQAHWWRVHSQKIAPASERLPCAQRSHFCPANTIPLCDLLILNHLLHVPIIPSLFRAELVPLRDHRILRAGRHHLCHHRLHTPRRQPAGETVAAAQREDEEGVTSCNAHRGARSRRVRDVCWVPCLGGACRVRDAECVDKCQPTRMAVRAVGSRAAGHEAALRHVRCTGHIAAT